MAEYAWKDYARALALAESLVGVASEEPPPSDAALRDEVCMARAVVAADIIIERLERERDEWKRKYEVQCAGSWSSAGERASLRAKLDTLTRELAAARKVCEKATRWWDTATVAHDAGVEYRVKGNAESRLRAVAADAAHADTIVGLGEAIEAYRATKERPAS